MITKILKAMNYFKNITLFASLILSISILAQERTHVTNHVISKKASKGYLYDYLINEEENRIELAYALKETPKKLLMETYVFKLDDLSFISSKEEEFEKEKVKYKRVKRSKDPIKLLKISSNIVSGKLKLHKGYLSYWSAGRAVLSKFIEESTPDVYTSKGDKFTYLNHRTETPDVTGHTAIGHISVGLGNVKIVGLEKEKPYYSKYGFTIYDAHTVTEQLYKSFDLKYSYAPNSVDFLPNGDVGIIFRPIIAENLPKTKGAKEKFNLDPDKNFVYVQLNTMGEVVANVKFKLDISKKGGLYNLGIAATDKKGEVVLFGVGKPDQYSSLLALNPKALYPTNKDGGAIDIGVKADKLVVVKIANGKLQFAKQYPMDELVSKAVLTENTKAPSDAQKYVKAGNLTLQDATIDNSGNVLITMKCRNWHQAMQLSPVGDVVTNFFDNSDLGTCVSNEFIKNGSGETFWINYDMPKLKSDATSDDYQNAFAQRSGIISKVNSSGKKLEGTISLAPEGVRLDSEEPFKLLNENEFLILGNGKKKEINLSKLVLK